MDDKLHMRSGGFLCVVLTLTLTLAGCGGRVSDKDALEAHFKKTPDRSILSNPGPIRSVECSSTSLTFRGSNVYVCDAAYDDGTIGVVCGARIEGEVVTDGLPKNCIP
jgi:hypothetical protein